MLVKRITRNGDVIDYSYDVHGRLISEEDISYVYDNNGNLLEAVEDDKEIIREYDELNRVIEKEENGRLSTYTYDMIGYKEKTVDPAGNIIIKEYDEAGRLKSVNEEVEYEYNVDGTLKKLVYANGVEEEYFYNLDKTLNRLVNTNDDIIEEYIYEYDNAKNITKEISPDGTVISTYDALSRLKTVNKNGVTTTYTYDASGNRTREVTGLKVNDYVYDHNNKLDQITEKISGGIISITIYTYDDNGNQLEERVNTVLATRNEYNYKNELISTESNNEEVEYEYDSEGKRISKTSDDDTVVFIYEGRDIILEVDEEDNVLAQNIYGNALVARETDSVKGYYLYNGHGDVVGIVDEDGEILVIYEYDIWGNILGIKEERVTERVNLFDKNNNEQIISMYAHSGSSSIVADSTTRSVYIPCLPNTVYTISKVLQYQPLHKFLQVE